MIIDGKIFAHGSVFTAFTSALFVLLITAYNATAQNDQEGKRIADWVWNSDQGDGTYRNPVIFADYSDPDVIRIGKYFYMVSSSFNCTPVLPLLKSEDLVNWIIIGHVSRILPSSVFDTPQHGKGCWAPSIRFHDNQVWVFYGDPDLGIFMSKAPTPEGPWTPIERIKEAKGWIDPCPFWDDDGKAYLVHAWAKSRAGFNSILTVHRMNPDGRALLDDGVIVFNGRAHHPTIEGPKFYKRNGYYYIFAPAGGVKEGWQTVLRAKNIFGPYEDKIVLHQGASHINGPHQGAWIESSDDSSWFLHFQDRGVYGRIIHIQPMIWKNDWPVIGSDSDSDGVGEPVMNWRKPENTGFRQSPQTTDEFSDPNLGLQWQWPSNPVSDWISLSAKPGWLRLFAADIPDTMKNFWSNGALLLQKFPAPEYSAAAKIDGRGLMPGSKCGIIIMGKEYAYLAVEKKENGFQIVYAYCREAASGKSELSVPPLESDLSEIVLKVQVKQGGMCQFSYSKNGEMFYPIGVQFQAREGLWIGAKMGLFCSGRSAKEKHGYADVDWWRVGLSQSTDVLKN